MQSGSERAAVFSIHIAGFVLPIPHLSYVQVRVSVLQCRAEGLKFRVAWRAASPLTMSQLVYRAGRLGLDVPTIQACQIFSVHPNEVSPMMREAARTLNEEWVFPAVPLTDPPAARLDATLRARIGIWIGDGVPAFLECVE